MKNNYSKGKRCLDCNKPITNQSLRCVICSHKNPDRRQKVSKALKGRRPGNYKGGRIKRNGYILIYQPDHPRANNRGYVYEHILVAEKTLGREIPRGYVDHHMDGNRSNNNPLNLAIMKNGTHLRFHIDGHL